MNGWQVLVTGKGKFGEMDGVEVKVDRVDRLRGRKGKLAASEWMGWRWMMAHEMNVNLKMIVRSRFFPSIVLKTVNRLVVVVVAICC